MAYSAWLLGKEPWRRILILSYSEVLATDITFKVLQIIKSAWYQEIFPIRLPKAAADDVVTSKGGGIKARSIEGSVTGFRADVIIIDDPLQIRHHSNTDRLQKLIEDFHADIETRLNNPKTGIIAVVAHRLNETDLCGHLQSLRGWRRRVLPFVAKRAKEVCYGDGEVWHRAKGELLRPAAFTKAKVRELRETTTGPGFGPLYQQSFKIDDVLQIKRKHFGAAPKSIPRDAVRILSVDPAQKPGIGHSYTVLQCWAVVGVHYVLVDQWRKQEAFPAVRKALRSMIKRHWPSAILIEATGPGPALASGIKQRKDMAIIEITPSDGKSARLRDQVDVLRGGRVPAPIRRAVGRFRTLMNSHDFLQASMMTRSTRRRSSLIGFDAITYRRPE